VYTFFPGMKPLRSHTRTCSHHATNSLEYLKQQGQTYSLSSIGVSLSRFECALAPLSAFPPFVTPPLVLLPDVSPNTSFP
jgi:hypothetical protein